MRLSANGLDLIKTYEGLRLETYKDVAGHATVGYGHKLKKDEAFSRLSMADAEALLRIDVAHFEHGVSELCSEFHVTQGQFDALVSFAYNVGLSALEKSTLLKKLKAGDIAGAAREFERWIHAGGLAQPGLRKRRAAEARLFLSDTKRVS